MNVEGKTVWQHAAGDWGHEHVDISLEWQVILAGSDVPLREEMQIGDIVVLKVGVNNIYGVGSIGEYSWRDEFNDVDGWDLGHARRVRRVWTYEENDNTPMQFDGRPLARSTTCRLRSPEILDWPSGLNAVGHDNDCSYAELPEEQKNVTREDIAKYLFGMGIASDSIRSLLDRHGEFLRIASWHDEHWEEWPSEHETVSHLVVPLLRILGWTPQRMALEWKMKGERKKMDLALFARLQQDAGETRVERNLECIAEAKRLRDPSLSWAVDQAKGCSHEIESRKRLIVTDGLRYGVFTRRSAKEGFAPYAYLNLIRLRSEYPIYGCRGAREAIFSMTSGWKSG